jgi:FecR-like protein
VIASILIVALQYMVSAKAGLINYIEGQTNVRLHQQVAEGMPIETGPRGHVEVLLNPGSFLRLGEHSSVVLDSVELSNMSVRVVEGAALIEAAEIDKKTPIRVSTGGLHVTISTPGVYRFFGDTAAVVDGKLRVDDSSMTIKKGRQVTEANGNYIEGATALAFSDGLDSWSERRSDDVAKANALAYRSYSSGNGYAFGGYNPFLTPGPFWLYSPVLSGFTWIPTTSYRTFYGYRLVPAPVFVSTGSAARTSSASSSLSRANGSVGRAPTIGSGARAPRVGRIGSRR